MPNQTRNAAVKLWISDIINNNYVPGDDQIPNHVVVNNQKITRVNILGIIINKTTSNTQGQLQMVDIEDGTGKIQAITFDAKQINADIGDCVFVIGRPRIFNSQKYVAIDILKKMSQPEWIDVRKKEVPIKEYLPTPQEGEQERDTTITKIIEMIKQKDTGTGADYEQIIIESNINNADEILKKLLQNGDVFQVSPGKIKVLE